jgi:ATP-binding cassette subfamily F protein 3
MLTIDGLTYRIAGRTLLERASARLPAGARIGLVGRNGTGKSTLGWWGATGPANRPCWA